MRLTRRGVNFQLLQGVSFRLAQTYRPEFDDLDDLFYEIEADMMEKLSSYIKENAKDFYFSGDVTIPY